MSQAHRLPSTGSFVPGCRSASSLRTPESPWGRAVLARRSGDVDTPRHGFEARRGEQPVPLHDAAGSSPSRPRAGGRSESPYDAAPTGLAANASASRRPRRRLCDSRPLAEPGPELSFSDGPSHLLRRFLRRVLARPLALRALVHHAPLVHRAGNVRRSLTLGTGIVREIVLRPPCATHRGSLPRVGWHRARSALMTRNEAGRVHRTLSPSRGSAYPSNEPSEPRATRLTFVQRPQSGDAREPGPRRWHRARRSRSQGG